MELVINGDSEMFPAAQFHYGEFEHRVQKYAAENQLLFSHIVINGQEVFDNFERTITDNISEQLRLEVIFATRNEYKDQLLSDMHRYLHQIQPAVEALSQKFHQQPSPEDWESFVQLTEGIQWLLTAGSQVSQLSEEETPSLMEMSGNLSNKVAELFQALETKDYTLVGDLLTYEFNPLFQQFQVAIKELSGGGEGKA